MRTKIKSIQLEKTRVATVYLLPKESRFNRVLEIIVAIQCGLAISLIIGQLIG